MVSPKELSLTQRGFFWENPRSKLTFYSFYNTEDQSTGSSGQRFPAHKAQRIYCGEKEIDIGVGTHFVLWLGDLDRIPAPAFSERVVAAPFFGPQPICGAQPRRALRCHILRSHKHKGGVVAAGKVANDESGGGVDFRVPLEPALGFEGFAAAGNRAVVRLVRGVEPRVLLELALGFEGFAAASNRAAVVLVIIGVADVDFEMCEQVVAGLGDVRTVGNLAPSDVLDSGWVRIAL